MEILTSVKTATRIILTEKVLRIVMVSIVLWVSLILLPAKTLEKVASFLSAAASVAQRSLSSSRGTELYRKSST